jgi:adenosylhomocysteine nucleosidase
MIIVAALQQEVEGLPWPIQLTGVGKINATRVMVESIMRNKPNQVVNFGTAAKCSRRVEVGKIYEIKKFIQRDMDATPLGFDQFETPFGQGAIETGLVLPSNLVCGTGDNFWEGDSQFIAEYDVADMEAYALAVVCKSFDVPFKCFKYISDEGNADQWEENCKKGVELFLKNVK